jgi:hypothetical protein
VADHACDYDLYLRVTAVAPVFCHGEIVAEWRMHDTNASYDPLRMLRSTLRTYRRQERHVARDPELHDAYTRGRRFWEDRYGNAAIESVLAHLKNGEWRRTVALMVTILRYSPRVLLHRVFRPLTGVARRPRAENADVHGDPR